MQISAEELSKPISEDQPCGEDLEYDPAFQQMETLMQPKAEREVGDSVIPAEPPDWKGVTSQVKDLLGRTRDLRVMVNGATASLYTGSPMDFYQFLVAINNCMADLWDEIHPLLDPDDDLDPLMRMNVLQNLNDYRNVCLGLMRSPLVTLRGVGPISFRDIALAEGHEEPEEDEEVIDTAVIHGAFSEADTEHLTGLAEALTGAVDEFHRMSDIWAEKTDNYEQPDVSGAVGLLRDILESVSSYSPTLAEAAADEDEGAGEAGTAEAPAVSGSINTPSDVIKAIDRICEYYNKHEPSSPIPILLRRAQRLVAKSFLEILEDIVPDSVDQVRALGGSNASSED